jgi:hypothetical protein
MASQARRRAVSPRTRPAVSISQIDPNGAALPGGCGEHGGVDHGDDRRSRRPPVRGLGGGGLGDELVEAGGAPPAGGPLDLTVGGLLTQFPGFGVHGAGEGGAPFGVEATFDDVGAIEGLGDEQFAAVAQVVGGGAVGPGGVGPVPQQLRGLVDRQRPAPFDEVGFVAVERLGHVVAPGVGQQTNLGGAQVAGLEGGGRGGHVPQTPRRAQISRGGRPRCFTAVRDPGGAGQGAVVAPHLSLVPLGQHRGSEPGHARVEAFKVAHTRGQFAVRGGVGRGRDLGHPSHDPFELCCEHVYETNG